MLLAVASMIVHPQARCDVRVSGQCQTATLTVDWVEAHVSAHVLCGEYQFL